MTANEQDQNESGPDPSEQGEDPVATDPKTGSTPPDPQVEDVGLPPGGADPMAGESPSS